jgi:hypothetical protein
MGMNSFVFQLYRIVVPKPIRKKILLSQLQKKIPAYYSSIPSSKNDAEVQEVLHFITRNGVRIFPYEFTGQYDLSSIAVFDDSANGLKYVLQDGKRLYFKRRWSADRIRRSFHDLTLEQDAKSPHRYLSAEFDLNADDVLADFGAAEGNFSLSVIERVKKIYLFEADQEWIEALQYTFAPWKDKVEIVPKFISDKNNDRNCSGDAYFKDKEVSFLKIDVDGGERGLLKGFETILSNRKPMRIALCTYHQHTDQLDFTELLEKDGYNVTPSPGYMIFYYDKKLRAPYLRRALIRAVKMN